MFAMKSFLKNKIVEVLTFSAHCGPPNRSTVDTEVYHFNKLSSSRANELAFRCLSTHVADMKHHEHLSTAGGGGYVV